MGVQHIYDADGRKTGVIVPVDLWDCAERAGEEEIGVSDPRKYRGVYRDRDVDLQDEIRKLRDEWNRQ